MNVYSKTRLIKGHVKRIGFRVTNDPFIFLTYELTRGVLFTLRVPTPVQTQPAASSSSLLATNANTVAAP